MGYYTDTAFFRVIKNFMAQVGISGTVTRAWDKSDIKDDPVTQSNKRGWSPLLRVVPTPNHAVLHQLQR